MKTYAIKMFKKNGGWIRISFYNNDVVPHLTDKQKKGLKELFDVSEYIIETHIKDYESTDFKEL